MTGSMTGVPMAMAALMAVVQTGTEIGESRPNLSHLPMTPCTCLVLSVALVHKILKLRTAAHNFP